MTIYGHARQQTEDVRAFAQEAQGAHGGDGNDAAGPEPWRKFFHCQSSRRKKRAVSRPRFSLRFPPADWSVPPCSGHETRGTGPCPPPWQS